MRVFVSEYLVGGASSGTAAPASMRREGLAMLQAVITDIARLPNWTSVTTLGTDVPQTLDAEVIRVNDAAHEAEVFDRLIRQVDAVLVIAPETDGALAERCRRVSTARVSSWNCSAEAIELCADKLRLADHLQSHDLPVISTALVDLETLPASGDFRPMVLKPRDGAGSNLIFHVNTLAEWKHAAISFRQAGLEHKCIRQQFVQGRNLSMGMNISLDGDRIECLPVAEQKLSLDGRFRYLGGCVPAEILSSTRDAIERVAVKACRTIPGVAGYLGFDILLSDREMPWIVEINPRLTTSYVGYRQLYSTPLPCGWLSATSELRPHGNHSVEWDVSSFSRFPGQT